MANKWRDTHQKSTLKPSSDTTTHPPEWWKLKDKKYQLLVRMWNSHTLLVYDYKLIKPSRNLFGRLSKACVPCDQVVSPKHILCLSKVMDKKVHTSIIQNYSQLETAHTLIKNKTDKNIVVYSGILHSNKYKQIIIPCNHMGAFHKYNIEKRKPGTKECLGEKLS